MIDFLKYFYSKLFLKIKIYINCCGISFYKHFFTEAFESSPKLFDLELRSCHLNLPGFSLHGLHNAQALQHLTIILPLKRKTNLNPNYYWYDLSLLQNLRSLKLRNGKFLNSANVIALGNNCEKLTILDIDVTEFNHFSNEAWVTFLNRRKNR